MLSYCGMRLELLPGAEAHIMTPGCYMLLFHLGRVQSCIQHEAYDR